MTRVLTITVDSPIAGNPDPPKVTVDDSQFSRAEAVAILSGAAAEVAAGIHYQAVMEERQQAFQQAERMAEKFSMPLAKEIALARN